MNKTDILVIGGGPAGVVAAVTAQKSHPSKKVTLIRKEEKGVIPCGIPYIFRRLGSVDENVMPDKSLLDNGIELVIAEAAGFDSEKKEVTLQGGDIYSYDKLILSLGSKAQPVPIPGADKDGVWLVNKDYEYLKKFREAMLKSKKVVIIGGGFIGVEFAEELIGIDGMEVSIVEMGGICLGTNFDEEFAIAAENSVKDKGVAVHVGRSVKIIGGDKAVEHVELDDGTKIEADLVIISIGAKPNVDLAEAAGVRVEEKGAIWVDEYLRTSVSDVFAVGDCAQTQDFITGRNIPVMLASVATSEARIAARNLYQLKVVRGNRGTVGVFSTYLNGLALGTAGLTENRAKSEGIDYVIGEAEAPNHHPGKLPDTEMIKVKLLFSASSENLLLGGEIMGPESIGEMVNILAMAIQQKASLFDFETWQIATHPLLTSAPTTYPLIAAAQNAMLKLHN